MAQGPNEGGRFFPLPEDIRFMVYAALASGSRGLSYRGTFPEPREARAFALFSRLNREVQALKPLLCKACPVEWVRCDSARIAAKALLAGEDAVVVVLLDSARLASHRQEVHGTVWPAVIREPVHIAIRIPRGVQPRRVSTLYEELPLKSWTFEGGAVECDVLVGETGQALIVELERLSFQRTRTPSFSDEASSSHYEPPKSCTKTWTHLEEQMEGTAAFAAVRQRLHAAQRIKDALLTAITTEELSAVSASAVCPAIALPDNGPIGVLSGRRGGFPAPGRHLYLSQIDLFTRPLPANDQAGDDYNALLAFYDGEMLRMSRDVIKRIAASALIGMEGQWDVYSWALALPLLEAADGRQVPRWEDLLQASGLGGATLGALEDSCLLDFGVASHAVAIARYRRRQTGTDLDVPSYCLDGASRFEKDRRPDAAWELLGYAAENAAGRREPAADLWLRMVETALRAGDYDRAVAHCVQLESRFRNEPVAHEAAYMRLVCLSKKGDFRGILPDLERQLETCTSEKRAAELLYLKWWALRQEGHLSRSRATAERLLAQHATDPVAAPVMFWQAKQALTEGDYDAAEHLLNATVERFPNSQYGRDAAVLLARLKHVN
jgi:hypothetical protein